MSGWHLNIVKMVFVWNGGYCSGGTNPVSVVNNFMLDEHTVHSVEFEAPLSSDGAAQRHFSIDLSLELERQLDMETFPPTPTHPNPPGAADISNRESLDPHILAHIIKQLQQSLADVTKDRDELRQLIASAHSNQAELQDALQHMIDKATTMEMELTDARQKIKDDEEAIALLRSKVEESRCVGFIHCSPLTLNHPLGEVSCACRQRADGRATYHHLLISHVVCRR